MRRVVVTGIGMMSPIGNTVAETWQALLAGKSGVDRLSLVCPETFKAKIAAEVKNFDAASHPIASRYPNSGRNVHFGLIASQEAVDQSGILDGFYQPEQIGVYTGSGEGAQDFPEFMGMIARSYDNGNVDMKKFTQIALSELHPEREFEQEPHAVPGHLAGRFQFFGPNANTLTACAAAAQAIGESAELIRQGDADAMLTGGSTSMIHYFGMTGFSLLTTLSTRNDDPQRASRPFDRDRDGFVLGEGAGMLILEEYESAKKRGANILAELTGYGSTADAYRVTDIHPEGRGAAASMTMALKQAKLNPEQIDYLNAHGTSTKANDKLETMAIKTAFGERAKSIPISSTKSMTGHLVAASGGIESIFAILAMQKGAAPPTINFENRDPECDLDYIPNTARDLPVKHVLSNSFGFGGQNISLVFSAV